jgi:hypothetical protein
MKLSLERKSVIEKGERKRERKENDKLTKELFRVTRLGDFLPNRLLLDAHYDFMKR